MKTISHRTVSRRQARGFTLLEMVIVLALIGLAMGGDGVVHQHFLRASAQECGG